MHYYIASLTKSLLAKYWPLWDTSREALFVTSVPPKGKKQGVVLTFYTIAPVFQPLENFSLIIALNDNFAIFDTAAGATFGLQLFA